MADLTGKTFSSSRPMASSSRSSTCRMANLQKAGATVDIVSPEAGEINGWDQKDWGRPSRSIARSIRSAADDYDAIVLPGGQMNPDTLRGDRRRWR